MRRRILILLSAAALTLLMSACINPFAPKLDTSPAQSACDPHTVEGIFQCFQAAYTFRDTTVYSPLIDPAFIFIYRDYDPNGLLVDYTWGRDEEMRTTFGLFQNAEKLDLIWNNIISSSQDSSGLNVVRGFNLTVVFNPSDIERVDGYANMTLQRAKVTDPWKITRWRDESNY